MSTAAAGTDLWLPPRRCRHKQMHVSTPQPGHTTKGVRHPCLMTSPPHRYRHMRSHGTHRSQAHRWNRDSPGGHHRTTCVGCRNCPVGNGAPRPGRAGCCSSESSRRCHRGSHPCCHKSMSCLWVAGTAHPGHTVLSLENKVSQVPKHSHNRAQALPTAHLSVSPAFQGQWTL